MKRGSALAFAALLMTPMQALASDQAERPCVTTGEARALISFALPSLVTGLAGRCQASLGPDAYLPQAAPGLSQRYRAMSASAWPAARGAIEKLSGTRLPGGISDETLRSITEAGISGTITDKVNTRDCGMVDGIFSLLAPLPPENISALVAILVQVGARQTQRSSSFRICPAT